MTPPMSDARSLALLTPQSVPPNRVWPHLRSEVSRLTHRRLYRALAVLLLLGISAVSAIVFVNSSETPTMTASAREQYERDLASWQQEFDEIHAGWRTCVAEAGADAEQRCGPEPSIADGPRPEYYGAHTPYVAEEKLPAVLIAVTMAGAMLAFVLGASSGGAEWSSRSMTLQLLWEPRRTRLLALKWVALGVVVAVTTLVGMVEGLAFGAFSAATRGRWATAGEDAAVPAGLWSELAGVGGRGLVLVVVVASFGYAIAMLVRNTGAALGTAFVYFAVVENAVRIAFMRYGSEQFMLTTNAGAFVIPGGVEVPGRMTTTTDPSGGSSTESIMVHIGNGRALVTLLVYLLVIGVPAWWSFTRRDVS